MRHCTLCGGMHDFPAREAGSYRKVDEEERAEKETHERNESGTKEINAKVGGGKRQEKPWGGQTPKI